MEWNEVKEKPKKKTTHKPEGEDKPSYGGKTKKGTLVAGPVYQGQMHAEEGALHSHDEVLNNQASAIAEFDYHVDDEKYTDEIHYETITHECAQAVSEARLAAKLTQDKLAHQIGQKTAVIVEIENGSARYDANIINAIEKALGVKIPRGRGKKKHGTH